MIYYLKKSICLLSFLFGLAFLQAQNEQNNALDLNGGAFVSITDASSLLAGTNFTVECMINISAFPENGYGAISGFHPGGQNDRSPSLWIANNENASKGLHYDSYDPTNQARYGDNISDLFPDLDKWYHIAWVKDSTEYRIYVDGQLIHTRTGVPANMLVNPTFNIGKTDNDMEGFVDEFRIWSVARSQAEIQEFISQELSGTESGLQAYYNFNQVSGTAVTDVSGNGFGAALDGGAGSSDFTSSTALDINNSVDLSRTDRYIRVENAGSLLSGTDFTVECMINFDLLPLFFGGIGGYHQPGGGNMDRSPSMWATSAGDLHYNAYDSNGVPYNGTTTSQPFQNINTWYHIAWVKDGSVFRFYVDGELIHSHTGIADNLKVYSVYQVGRVDNQFSGLMDEYRIWSVARTQNEIQANMTNELLGNEPGLQLYYNFNISGGAVVTDHSGNELEGTLLGAGTNDFIKSSAFDTNKSLDLNGNGYLSVANASNLLSGTDFTVECMMNISAFPSEFGGIAGFQGVAPNRSPSLWITNTAGAPRGLHYDSYDSSGARYSGEFANVFPDLNKWYHVAWVKEGTEYRIYVDGQLLHNHTGVPMNLNVNSIYTIGRVNNNMEGFLDEFRIWSVARTAEDIQEFMSQELKGNESGLQAYYNFNPKSLTGSADITDASGNAFGASFNSGLGRADVKLSTAFTEWVNSGTGNTDWNSQFNWTNGVPGQISDNVSIAAGGKQPEITNNVGLSNLNLTKNASLRITGTGSLTTTGNSTLGNGAILNVDSAASMTIGAGSYFRIAEGGMLDAAGEIAIGTTGKIMVDVNAKAMASGDLTVNAPSGIELKSTVEGTGNLVYQGNNLMYSDSGSVKVERYLGGVSGNFNPYHYISSPIKNHPIFTDPNDLYAYSETDLTWIHHNDPTDGFNQYSAAKGYAIRYTSNVTKSFVGEINSGDVTVSVSNTANGGNVFEHYNLIGNPYPSSINVKSFVDGNTILNNTVTFWNGIDYTTYNTSLSAGTAGVLGGVPDGNVAVGQAFFVESNAAGTATFTNAMQSTDSDQFFRESSKKLIRLNVKSEGELFNQLIVGEHYDATAELDALDSRKLIGNEQLAFYSMNDDNKLAIQTFPELNSELVVPLGLETDKSAWFEFSKDIQSDLVTNLYLWDSYKDEIIDLNTKNYKVYLEEGLYQNRFKMLFERREKTALPVNEPAFRAYVNGANIQLDLSEDYQIETLRLFSINGQLIKSFDGAHGYNVSDVQNGVYILQLNSKEGISLSTRFVIIK